jgi:hypothetical protein
VLPLPEGEKTTKEELEAMERRNDDLLTNYSMDNEKIGWYLICYTRNFWDNLETMKYYEVHPSLLSTTSTPASSSSSTTRRARRDVILTKHSALRSSSRLLKTSSGPTFRRQTLNRTILLRRSLSRCRKMNFSS